MGICPQRYGISFQNYQSVGTSQKLVFEDSLHQQPMDEQPPAFN